MASTFVAIGASIAVGLLSPVGPSLLPGEAAAVITWLLTDEGNWSTGR
jgi:hypothetical protein